MWAFVAGAPPGGGSRIISWHGSPLSTSWGFQPPRRHRIPHVRPLLIACEDGAPHAPLDAEPPDKPPAGATPQLDAEMQGLEGEELTWSQPRAAFYNEVNKAEEDDIDIARAALYIALEETRGAVDVEAVLKRIDRIAERVRVRVRTEEKYLLPTVNPNRALLSAISEELFDGMGMRCLHWLEVDDLAQYEGVELEEDEEGDGEGHYESPEARLLAAIEGLGDYEDEEEAGLLALELELEEEEEEDEGEGLELLGLEPDEDELLHEELHVARLEAAATAGMVAAAAHADNPEMQLDDEELERLLDSIVGSLDLALELEEEGEGEGDEEDEEGDGAPAAEDRDPGWEGGDAVSRLESAYNAPTTAVVPAVLPPSWAVGTAALEHGAFLAYSAAPRPAPAPRREAGDPLCSPARDYLLPSVVERRAGAAVAVGILYIAVAKRLGLELRGAGFPAVFCVRPDEASTGLGPDAVPPLFVDLSRQGALLTPWQYRAYCESVMRALEPPEDPGAPAPDRDPAGPSPSSSPTTSSSPAGPSSPPSSPPASPSADRDRSLFLGSYFGAVGHRTVLARLLSDLKLIYIALGDTHRALAVLDRLLLLGPGSREDLRDRGIILYHFSRWTEARADLEAFLAGAGEGADPAAGAGAGADVDPEDEEVARGILRLIDEFR
eukprot:tig00020685_g12934.t1